MTDAQVESDAKIRPRGCTDGFLSESQSRNTQFCFVWKFLRSIQPGHFPQFFAMALSCFPNVITRLLYFGPYCNSVLMAYQISLGTGESSFAQRCTVLR